MQDYPVHFGGPHVAPRLLRNLLAERIAAVPSGGAIDWVTYYFRDRGLARDLLQAHRRGVQVRVTVDGDPRTPRTNRAVAEMLSNPAALGTSFRSVVHAKVPLLGDRPRLHEKLYCFSHPVPHALVGSFNPSGDEPEEDPSIIEEIRDQDRGHNVLVEIRGADIVAPLVAHARRVHAGQHTLLERLSPQAWRVYGNDALSVHLRPSVRRNPVIALLRQLGKGADVRFAASHLKGTTAPAQLVAAARRGARIAILAEPTERRVPGPVLQRLTDAGISVRRVGHPQGLPMHAKFLLAEQRGRRCVAFGSFNLTERSLRLNHEIFVVSSRPQLVEAFERQWGVLQAQADAWMRNT